MITNSSILDSTLEYEIKLYIREDETREGMLEKFGNDKIKLVQFLRKRAFASNKTPESKQVVPVKSNTVVNKQKEEERQRRFFVVPEKKINKEPEADTNQPTLF